MAASGLGRHHVLSALLKYTNLNRKQLESRVSIQVVEEEKKKLEETTALVVACANGHEACVKCLLDYSVDPDITTSDGTSPVLALSICRESQKHKHLSQKHKLHILHRLIRANADLNQGNDLGTSIISHFHISLTSQEYHSFVPQESHSKINARIQT